MNRFFNPPQSFSQLFPYLGMSEGSDIDAVSWVMDSGFKLVCLDIDGTIVETNTSSELIPEAEEFLAGLASLNVKIALVTNQGAVGLRHWMQTNSFGEPESLPSQDEVEKRINLIVAAIKKVYPVDFPVLMAFRFQSKGDAENGKKPRWGPVPFNCKSDPRWKQEWRKPNPGMILTAMTKCGLSMFEKKKALMIGDMDTDEAAAKAAGVSFKRAPKIFKPKKSDSPPAKKTKLDVVP